MAPRLNFPYNFGTLGVKSSIPILTNGFCPQIYLKIEAGFFVRKIAGYYYILTHCALLL